MPTSAQGVHGSGRRDYTVVQARLISAELKYHVGAQNPVTVEELANLTGVGGRAVRQFLGDYDGVWFLLGGGDDGYYLCEWTDESERFTRRIRSQVTTMQGRINRRETFAQTLPTMQSALFGGH